MAPLDPYRILGRSWRAVPGPGGPRRTLKSGSENALPRPDARGADGKATTNRVMVEILGTSGTAGSGAQAPTSAAGAVSWSDGGPGGGFPAAGGDAPSSPDGRRAGKTPNGHGGRTSIDNVVVQRVRGRVATTTTKGKGNEFRRRFNPKKAGDPRRPAASRGSHCPATASVVSSFFPRRPHRSCRIVVRRSIRPAAAEQRLAARSVAGNSGF